MGKLQFEVRFLVEADAPASMLEPKNLGKIIERDNFIRVKAQELQQTNPVSMSVIDTMHLYRGVKDYTQYISRLSAEAYRDILRLMKERGYSEFDFHEHGTQVLPSMTCTDDFSTQSVCTKIVVQDDALSFQGDDGNSYSFPELEDTDIFYILDALLGGLSANKTE